MHTVINLNQVGILSPLKHFASLDIDVVAYDAHLCVVKCQPLAQMQVL
jgi:hypothetical protein